MKENDLQRLRENVPAFAFPTRSELMCLTPSLPLSIFPSKRRGNPITFGKINPGQTANPHHREQGRLQPQTIKTRGPDQGSLIPDASNLHEKSVFGLFEPTSPVRRKMLVLVVDPPPLAFVDACSSRGGASRPSVRSFLPTTRTHRQPYRKINSTASMFFPFDSGNNHAKSVSEIKQHNNRISGKDRGDGDGCITLRLPSRQLSLSVERRAAPQAMCPIKIPSASSS